MGLTLEHEHILVDFIGADSTGYFRWNKDEVIRKALPFVMAAKKKALRPSLNVHLHTLDAIRFFLRNYSKNQVLNSLQNTGYYERGNNFLFPKFLYFQTQRQVAELWAESLKMA